MRKLILLTFLLVSTIWSFGQDIKPTGENIKQLQAPNSPSFYYNTVDSTIGIWKGAYKWNYIWSAKKTRRIIDSLALHGADTLQYYRLLTNHDSLSTLQEKNYSSLDGKPDLTVYKLKSDSTAADGFTRRDRLASELAKKKNISDSTAASGYTRRDRLASELAKKVDKTVLSDLKVSTGFLDGSNIAVSYDWATRKVTLTGTLDYYYNGVKKTLTSPWTSAAHDATVGKWFLSSSDGTNFTWSQAAWTFDMIMVSFVNYQATQAGTFAIKETHGTMDWKSHEELHQQIGTYLLSGGTLIGGTYAENTATDAANSPSFNAAVLKDEDLNIAIPEWPEGTYTTMYVGAVNSSVFNISATVPFLSSGSYLQYNNTTTGALVSGSNNNFYNVYQLLIPVSSSTSSQKYRVVMLQPQQEFTSLAAAKAEDTRGLNLGDLTNLSPEFVMYARITYTTAAGDANTGKCRISTGGVSYILGSKMSNVSASGAITNNHATQSNLTWVNSGHLGTANTAAFFNATGIAVNKTLVTDSINDNVLGRAPSQNKVFDALAGKVNLADSSGVALGSYTTGKDFQVGLAGKEPTLTKGTLTENIDGLVLSDSTRQVIGGATVLGVKSGRVIPTSTNISHAETAYTHSQNDGDLSASNELDNANHSGDATGATALTLATVNSNVGTYNNVTINAKGLATAGSNVSYLVASDISGKKDVSDSTAIAGYTRRDRLASELAKKENTFTKNTGFNLPIGTTTGTVLEGRTFGTAASSAITDFAPASGSANYVQVSPATAQTGNIWLDSNIKGSTLQSTVATGTAPLTVASTTMVGNLYANRAASLRVNSNYPILDLNTINVPNEFSATSFLASSTNAFNVFNNHNAVLTVSLDSWESGNSNVQLGFNSGGDIFSRVDNATSWNNLWHSGNSNISTVQWNASKYQLAATDLFLDPFRTGYSGASGTVFGGNGISTSGSWKTLGDAGIEAAQTKGTLTETIDGLVLSDSTRQVIGGATVLGVKSGRVIPTSTNISHGESGYTGRISTFTTTGTSGAATFSSNTLNIPQYQAAGSYQPLATVLTNTSAPFTTTLESKLNGIAANATNVTNTNQLTNGAGFITSWPETDPNISTWARQPAKPSYTYSEVGAAPVFTSSTANYVFATPNGSTGVPSLRALVASDIPALDYLTGEVDGSTTNEIQTLTIGGTTSPTIALSSSNTATFASSTGISLWQYGGDITITNSAPFPGFGTTGSTSAYGNHAHSGVYEPALGNPTTNGYALVSTTSGTRSWVALSSGGIGEAPEDEAYYARSNGDWISLTLPFAAKANLSGATFTGAIYGTSATFTGSLNCAEGYRGYSDIRLKSNIQDIKSNINKIKFVQFDFRNDTTKRKHYGVIAQQVEKYMPELVSTDEKGIKSVAYIDLLIAKIAELEARIKKLEHEK